MNVDFNPGRNLTNDNIISGRDENVSRMSVSSSEYKSDISKKDKDIEAFGKGSLNSFDDFIAKVSVKNIAVESDALAVMSNCMSAEDFAKLQEEGYSPSNMEVDELVTNLDKIKATLAESGVDVKGFTDDLSDEQLEAITGSSAHAAAIKQALNDNFLPVDRENAEKVDSVISAAETLDKPIDSAVGYMINNELAPTVDNIYVASHSASSNNSGNRAAYYMQENGYIGKNATDDDLLSLKDQIENIIKDAGLEVNDETLEQAQWLLKNNIPLTQDNLNKLRDINGIQFPISADVSASAAAAALADGIDVKYADLTKTKSDIRTAVDIKNDTLSRLDTYENQISEYEKTGNVEVLNNIQDKEAFNPVKERRLLEETRLLMTSQVSLSLLKRGITLDTSDLQSLVEKLREEEKHFYTPLLIENDSNVSDDAGSRRIEDEVTLKLDLFNRTTKTIDDIQAAPTELIARLYTREAFTLDKAGEAARNLKADYERAGRTYEAVGTQVRADLGDSIKKAFRNVDDILDDLELELNKENEKAARILGYSEMEINEENIEGVIKAETAVANVINHMTPARTLKMIRDGENPLDMDMYELSERLINEDDETANDKYSEFLYKLDRTGEITENEKEAFIGFFRLFKKIERSDEKLIGKVLKADDKLTLSNILKASRTNRTGGIDVKVDEDFGMIEKIVSHGRSITDQIMSGFRGNPSENKEYFKEEAEYIREAVNVEKEVMQALENADIPASPVTISAMDALMNMRGSAINKLINSQSDDEKKDEIKAESKKLTEAFTSEESADKAYEKFTEKLNETVKETIEAADKYIDVKELRLVNKQLSIAGSLAKKHSYEVPVEINGRVTSINLKLIKDSENAGKVTATFETEETGKVFAQFKVSDGKVSGFIAAENSYFSDEMKKKEDTFKSEFKKAGFDVSSMGYASSKNIEINGAYLSDDNALNGDNVSTKELYTLAKAVISSISE